MLCVWCGFIKVGCSLSSIPQDDDEWDDYRENKKDYTGLKIENLVIEEPVKVEEEETEVKLNLGYCDNLQNWYQINEDGEVVKVKKDESGPWNKKDGENRGSMEQQETPEPEVKPSNHIIVEQPNVVGGSYVPPHMRGGGGGAGTPERNTEPRRTAPRRWELLKCDVSEAVKWYVSPEWKLLLI